MYGILLRLEDWGWVESRIDYPVDRAAPQRRYYSLAVDAAARTGVALTRAARRRTRGRFAEVPPGARPIHHDNVVSIWRRGYWKRVAVQILRYRRISVRLPHPLHADRNGK